VLLLCAHPGQAKEPSVAGGRLTFELQDLDGHPVTSSDPRFDGRVLLVTLWGTWCPPCLREIPTFNDLQRRLGARGLTVVAIAFEEGSDPGIRRRRLRDAVTEHGIEYLVMDGGATSEFESALPMMRDVRGLPVEITIDRSGLVVDCRNGYGYSRRWAKGLERRLDRLLDRE
jgi:thiol-disulfide isomerase/thioredoxin